MLLWLLGDETPSDPPLVLAQTPGTGTDFLVDRLLEVATRGVRRVLPEPEPEAPNAAVRGRYHDAWLVLPAAERRLLRLATGRGATSLRPFLDPAHVVVAPVEEPVLALAALVDEGVQLPKLRPLLELAAAGRTESRGPRPAVANFQSRALLLPLPEADDLPVSMGPPPDADRWRTLLFEDALPRYQVVPAADVRRLVEVVGSQIGCSAAAIRRTARVAERARETARPTAFTERHARALLALNWLDVELYDRLLPS